MHSLSVYVVQLNQNSVWYNIKIKNKQRCKFIPIKQISDEGLVIYGTYGYAVGYILGRNDNFNN